MSAAFPAAETAGDSNITAIGWADTVASIASVTDSAGNTYTTALPTFRGNGLSQAIYYASDAAAGSDTVTVTFDRTPSCVDVRISEYGGIGAFDVGAGATAATGDGSSGTATTTNANDLLFGAGMSGGAFTVAGTGHTSRVLTPNGGLTEDRAVTVSGAYSATATNVGPWLMQLAAFKAEGSGPSAPLANSTGSPTAGTAPLSVQFTDTSTGAPTAWAWTFGDGGTSTVQYPSHTYSAAGTYTGSLTATNAAGSNTTTKTGHMNGNTPTTGWPNATNTGVPAGTTLAPYTGPCTITTPDTVIDAKTVDCALVIQAADVSITRSKVNDQISLDTDDSSASRWSITVTVTDSEVDAGVIQQAAICCGNMTLLRVNSHGGQTAAQCEEKSLYCRVTDSWLHGQVLPDNVHWHLGGFLSDGTLGSGCSGTWCIELVHNTVVCDHPVNNVDEGCSGDINLIPNFATMSKVRVYNNYLGANTGSAFCTYGGEKSTSPYPHADHVTYQDNVFQRGTNNLCAADGPVTDFDVNGAGNTWVNNTWDGDGTQVPPAN